MNDLKLDNKADYIKVYADWHNSGIPGRTFYEKALYEVNKGYAEIIAPDAIKLTVKLPPLKERVLKRDNNICQYCGGHGDTIDHLIPQSQYKIFTTEEMTVCACKRCNQLKANKPMHVFIKELMKEELIKYINEKL
ncbi:HNH endonuclease [Cytobacillus kochii]|uniref:HNH endonuclease n=1 Tax=Cytobacillus kochii TaxID=859143 RepID=UPI001CD44CEF|nr:HNH endonuclease [Cytobacillus kochii]MCA1029304.1 HNH endonuclease [Cytobacillus kochii]